MAVSTISIQQLFPEILVQIRAITGMPVQANLQNVVFFQLQYAFNGVRKISNAARCIPGLVKQDNIDVSDVTFNNINDASISQINIDSTTLKIKNEKSGSSLFVIKNEIYNLPFIRHLFSQMMACKIILNNINKFGNPDKADLMMQLNELAKQCIIDITPE